MKTRNLNLTIKSVACSILLTGMSLTAFAQDDPLKALDSSSEPTTHYALYSFKSTRVINSQSLETLQEGVLDFRIGHRFGPLNGGAYQLWGLDQASTRFQFDYGIKDWLQVGVGHSTAPKSYGGYVKAKLLWQSKGKRNMPISVIYHGYTDINITNNIDPNLNQFNNRLSFTHQLIIGRKFSDGFSLQLMPTYVHYNIVPVGDQYNQVNDIYAVGIAFRQRISRRVSFNGEYYQIIGDNFLKSYQNSLSVGFDIETGGHVFQLHLTNSLAMSEPYFITQTTENWLKGGIHLGFNISRVFSLYEPQSVRL
jgi:hypothetical protein